MEKEADEKFDEENTNTHNHYCNVLPHTSWCIMPSSNHKREDEESTVGVPCTSAWQENLVVCRGIWGNDIFINSHSSLSIFFVVP
jgi:hypothetical protein